MNVTSRALLGALGGLGGTLVLTVFRKALAAVGAVGTTAPEQVIERIEELGFLENSSPGVRRMLVILAHITYGAGTGAALGLLRRERGGAGEEAAVGSALGILAWGAGWASWLPLTGVHLPPWKQRTAKVLLPVLDHAVFGAVWGLVYRFVRSGRV